MNKETAFKLVVIADAFEVVLDIGWKLAIIAIAYNAWTYQ